ncbi:MAG: NADH:flavin oxidoreductase [Deltaproteobacteria bacterium HGW-Deltaproteobacteria-19]|jgi:2,4-dienoyl-CoA reductase-like NADH-dependent reductase (Old Yellow Enzyme family)|nr:MAG: NADH:flavin oxidoreductase [Deltaproteobacteria bacterium HGW-Deltaproteobacteria-19]
MSLDALFSPVTVNGLTLLNRAVMPAMGTGYGNPDGTVSDRLVRYLARRARGGAGLIITEVCAVTPRGKGFLREIGAWSDDFISGLAGMAKAVHREGAKIALQLHHAGRETFAAAAGGTPEAPSPIPSVIMRQPCEEMSTDRIGEVVDSFASAALRAQNAGLDAVEIHGAHGYLLTQFLSPFSNVRTDRYGGSEENRMRFVLETVAAVRKAVGSTFPVLVRISADELIKGGYDLEFTKRLAPRLVSAGADAIHVSVGVYSTPGNLSIASMDTEAGFNLFRARAIREMVNVPVIAVGRINDPRLADRAIAAGDADLVSFGRQHLADPDFLAKAREGRWDDIRWCVSCNQGCIERLMYEMQPVTCTFNPECGNEREQAAPDTPGRRLWVIGAGPAGLSAALAAVERGLKVEVFEKEETPGGQVLPASRPPHKEAFLDWVNWAVRQAKERGVIFHCGREVDAELLKSGRPDAVVLAAGASPSVPKIPGIHGCHVFDARNVLTGRADPAGPAAVLGAGYVGMETADYLLARGIDVTILEMQAAYPVGKHTSHGYWLHLRLKERGARILLGTMVTGIGEHAVAYRQGEEEGTVPAASVITALGARMENRLEDVLREIGIPWRTVGDAAGPRRLLEAIHEGDRAGREI